MNAFSTELCSSYRTTRKIEFVIFKVQKKFFSTLWKNQFEKLLLYQPLSTEKENLNSGNIVNFVLHAFLALRKTSTLPKPLKTVLLNQVVKARQ